jgi:hypothetical protein
MGPRHPEFADLIPHEEALEIGFCVAMEKISKWKAVMVKKSFERGGIETEAASFLIGGFAWNSISVNIMPEILESEIT